MAIDFKNIQFKYVRINAGVSGIDTNMTEKKFAEAKPAGYYKCFVFPSTGFAGNDYDDLKNLVGIESSEMWDKINRDTFLGYNVEDNKFIVNLGAYMGLKDPDLKTDGSINHTGQAVFQEMEISTTKTSNCIITLKQTDGSDIYLKPAESKITTIDRYAKSVGLSSIAVDNVKKSVINVPLLVKTNGEQLWAKSPEDGSAIMVNDFVKSITTKGYENKLKRNNKEYGKDNYDGAGIFYSSVYKYGKKVMSFENTSSINPIDEGSDQIRIKNKTQHTDIELTYTNDLNDILNSDESLQFIYLPVSGNLYFTYNTLTSKAVSSLLTIDYGKNKWLEIESVLVENYDHNNKGVKCNLLSCDSRKPFIYAPDTKDFTIDNNLHGFTFSDIKNIPDGFIYLIYTRYGDVYRFKKNEPVKKKHIFNVVAVNSYLKIIGISNSYGSEVYDIFYRHVDPVSMYKDDVINATGFTDVPNDQEYKFAYMYPLITIYKI